MTAMKKLGLLGVVAAAALFAGCKPEEGEPDAGDNGFPQPDNTVVLNFTIDTSKQPGDYEDGDLEWKGSFTYDAETRMITYDEAWGGGAGPYVPLYDDGPWTSGGHEPRNATAGDDKFGAAVFILKPATDPVIIGYGAQTCCGSTGGWIWPGFNNGSVTINPTDTEVTVAGFAVLPDGTVDLKLVLDTGNLATGFSPSTNIKVKGTMSNWAEETAYDDGTHDDATSGDGKYTYTLSLNATARPLLPVGANVQWVWVIAGTEYKVSGEASKQGVSVFQKGQGESTWTDRTANIQITPNNDKNTYITIQ